MGRDAVAAEQQRGQVTVTSKVTVTFGGRWQIHYNTKI
jgi:hypothetical protein